MSEPKTSDPLHSSCGLIVRWSSDQNIPAGDFCIRIRQLGGVTKDVNGHAADGWQEDLEVGTSQQLGVHSARVLEESTTEEGLVDAKTLCDAWKVPHGIDRGFVGVDLDTLINSGESLEFWTALNDLAVDFKLSLFDHLVELHYLDMRFGLGDGRTDINTLSVFLKSAKSYGVIHLRPDLLTHGSPGIERDDAPTLLRFVPVIVFTVTKPSWLGSEDERWVGVGKIRPPVDWQVLHSDGESTIDAV
jgi:hypothetical protein